MNIRGMAVIGLSICLMTTGIGSAGLTAQASEVQSEETHVQEEGSVQEEAVQEEEILQEDGPFILGNSSENILNGGILAIDHNENIYFSNTEDNGNLYVSKSGVDSLMVSETSANINICENMIYYTTASGTAIRQYNMDTGEVSTIYESSLAIAQMYVVDGQSFYLLTEQGIYVYSGQHQELYTILENGDIAGFIPTAGGMIYSTGALFERTLFFNHSVVATNVFNFYTVEGYLLFTADGTDYQVELNAMNDSFDPAVDVQKYSLGEIRSRRSAFGGDSHCEICEQNAQDISLNNMEAQVGQPLSARAAITPRLSQGVQNIVKRARQQHEIQWIPLHDISGWAGTSTFQAGTKYSGVPYGQPVYASYVPWYTSLDKFANAVETPASKMYTAISEYNKKAPYYSSDCSSFVSWAWDLDKRQTTWGLPGFAIKVGSQSVYSVQVGDAFIAEPHTVLVTNVGYDAGGKINSIEIIEQTPPKTKRTVYGVGGTSTLEKLTEKYLKDGYALYRCKERDSATYAHSCAVPLGDKCGKCEDFGVNVGGTGTDLKVSYHTHVQTHGWEKNYSSNGAQSGTVGKGKRLEGIQIIFEKPPVSGDITYRTHVQSYGWESDYSSNGELSGTIGKAKRLEAIQIKLTGKMAEKYDVYYRVHAQTYDWLGWAKNGASAGTEGLAKRLEAIEIQLVAKGQPAPGPTSNAFVTAPKIEVPDVSYKTHIQTLGWQSFVSNGAMSGTEGLAKRLESICVNLGNSNIKGGVTYRTHVQTHGWKNWMSNGAESGTTGQAKRLEAIQIKLTEDKAEKFDIYYRVHSQTHGWLGWAKNGASAGTEGLAKRLEAIQIKVVRKGQAAPGPTGNAFIKK